MSLSLNHIQSDYGRIYYRINGSENTDAMVMIHGLAGDSRFFHNQMKYFSSKFKVISIDLPGHGRSMDFEDQSLELYAHSINQVILTEKLHNYILMGHSMGGAICLDHYGKNSENIRSMILISTAAVLPVNRELIEDAENNFHNFFDNLLGIIFSKKAGIFILAAKKNITDPEKAVIINDLKICSSMNYATILEKINIPVLLVANTGDRMIPWTLTDELHKQISGSKLVIFEENGHVPFFEDHEKFNMAVDDFLRENL